MFSEIQNRCVRATDELSRLVIEKLKLLVNDLQYYRIFVHMSLRLRGKLSYGNKANSNLLAHTRRKSLKSFAASEFERKVQG
jgi:hypothetical protein